MSYTVLHAPQDRAKAQLPLDRTTHEQLFRAVLA